MIPVPPFKPDIRKTVAERSGEPRFGATDLVRLPPKRTPVRQAYGQLVRARSQFHGNCMRSCPKRWRRRELSVVLAFTRTLSNTEVVFKVELDYAPGAGCGRRPARFDQRVGDFGLRSRTA